ncbi:CBO0543 family protein [Bacillus litorisediminis]|uniref:CBO0543 family protein n=1 Tax=Bacillus litorisediminis TaxID=2922713 RepID=UPI0028BD1BB9|nr:CBO0543 family protein [Bacillus litorisediminis]
MLDSKRALQIWCFGLIVMVITSFADDLGSEMGAWVYPIKLVPFGLLAYPFDFTIIPITFMLIYQYCSKWRTYIIFLFFTAFIFSFIGEPLSVSLGFVTYVKWRYVCSFAFYIVTGLVSRLFIEKISM